MARNIDASEKNCDIQSRRLMACGCVRQSRVTIEPSFLRRMRAQTDALELRTSWTSQVVISEKLNTDFSQ